MNKKVFVGSLSFSTTNQGLADYFAQAGTVTSANIIVDRMNGKSKGFGFVEFSSAEEAQAAVDKFNNTELDGRNIFVDIARPNEKSGGGFRKAA
jgi:RNA recognition motif-containing protein